MSYWYVLFPAVLASVANVLLAYGVNMLATKAKIERRKYPKAGWTPYNFQEVGERILAIRQSNIEDTNPM